MAKKPVRKVSDPNAALSFTESGPPLFDGMFRTQRKVRVYSYRRSDGSIEKIRQAGPLAYILNTPAFESFLKAYEEVNEIAGKIMRARHMHNESVLNDQSLGEKLVAFNRRYGLLLDNLLNVNDGGTPFFNASYFPRSAKDAKYFWRFVDLANAAYSKERGDSSGRPPGTSKYALKDLSRYDKLRKDHDGAEAIERAFPDAFEDDSAGDPYKRLKPALSRLRKKKKARAPKRAPLFRRD